MNDENNLYNFYSIFGIIGGCGLGVVFIGINWYLVWKLILSKVEFVRKLKDEFSGIKKERIVTIAVLENKKYILKKQIKK